jgi:Cu+-exporting ATPase
MSTVLSSQTCYHCGEPCKNDQIVAAGHHFCCNGCRSVFQLINKHQLDDYYCMNENPGTSMQEVQPNKFSFLDDPAIESSLLSFNDGKLSRVTLYLPQIHCSSCLWLLEHLARAHPGILASQVNFPTKEISVAYACSAMNLRKLAELLTSLGYEPHITPGTAAAADDKHGTYDGKKAAYKLGITGFCFANIMLISFPEYLGMSHTENPDLAFFFRYVNLALALPVVFYGAREFFVNAWYSFRQRYINIDAPIALAITVTFLRSLYEIFTATGGGYLDSMSGIVFFMLLGRTLQNRSYSTLKFNRDYRSYFPVAVSKLENGIRKIEKIETIREDDILLIHHLEVLPTDCILSKGKAEIDYSFVNGESDPVNIPVGNIIYAGGKNRGSTLEVVAVKPFSQNSFTRLWNNKAFDKKGELKKPMTDIISRYFSLAVFTIAISAFVYWQFYNPANAWNALTAVLIVACPCSLLLTATFTNGYLVEYFAGQGFFLKNAGVIEKMSNVNHIAFDKTGTITETRTDHIVVKSMELDDEELKVMLAILSQSVHPLSRAIVTHYQYNGGSATGIHLKEIPGFGIEAWVNDRHWKLGSALFTDAMSVDADGSELFVWIDGAVKAHYQFTAGVKPGVAAMLRSLPFSLSMTSGDNDSSRSEMRQLLGPDATLHYRQSPADKLEHISQLQAAGKYVMMVGDGLNDAGALQQSDVGVAVVQQSFSFSPACDVIMESSMLPHLPRFLALAGQCRKLIMVGFIYSVLFNIVGVSIAVSAHMSPMIAAILMPSSSLGIMLIAFAGIRYASRKSMKVNLTKASAKHE